MQHDDGVTSSEVGTVGAVIVTYRSSRVLPALLDSLEREERELPLVVVDNASPEGPPSPGHGQLLVLPENRGFGSACNAGAERLLKRGVRYLMFLNPDIRLQGPSISQLAALMEARPNTGIATGPVVDQRGERVPSAWGPTSALRAFWFATGWKQSRLREFLGKHVGGGVLTSGASMTMDELEVDGHVLGGALVVRAACWQDLGGFDEDYFLYWEDADLCQRARRSGWGVRVLPCEPLIHEAGTSSANVGSKQRWRWYVEGARCYAERHLGRVRSWMLLVALWAGRRVGSRNVEHVHRS